MLVFVCAAHSSQLTFNYATAVAASEAPTVTEKNNVKIIVELW